MKLIDAAIVLLILLAGFMFGCACLAIVDNIRPSQYDNPAPVVHRQKWELDPQGQAENLSAEQCRAAGRTPYYIYPDNVTPFYEECLR